MMNFLKSLRVFTMARIGLLCLGTFLGTGCGSVRVVHKDPSFNRGTIRTSGIAIAGVTRLDQPVYYADNSVANVVAAHLQEAGVTVVKLGPATKLLGEAGSSRLRSAFFELGEATLVVLDELQPLRSQARFALLLNIMREEAPSYGGIHGQVVHDYVRNPHTGETYVFDQGVEYTAVKGSYRSMEVLFVLVDLELGKTVLTARGETSDGFANRSSDMNWVPHVKPTGNPTPSDLFEVMGEDFAKLLRD